MRIEVQILRGAADILRRDGWCQGGGLEGKSCILAAIGKYSNRNDIPMYAITRAQISLQRYLKIPVATVWQWNDVPGRTFEEVLAALEGCAQQLEQL